MGGFIDTICVIVYYPCPQKHDCGGSCLFLYIDAVPGLAHNELSTHYTLGLYLCLCGSLPFLPSFHQAGVGELLSTGQI